MKRATSSGTPKGKCRSGGAAAIATPTDCRRGRLVFVTAKLNVQVENQTSLPPSALTTGPGAPPRANPQPSFAIFEVGTGMLFGHALRIRGPPAGRGFASGYLPGMLR